MEAERLFLSKVIRTGDVAAAASQVRAGFFHDSANGEVWDFILEYWEDYAACPSPDMVRAEFPNWSMDKSPDPLDAYADLLARSYKRHATIKLLSEATDLIREEAIDDALVVMGTGLIDIAQAVVQTADVEMVETGEDRLDRWQDMAENPGALLGIPTGFNFIDAVTGGMQPEQFYVLIGPQKSGKSSIAMEVAISANDAGHSVLVHNFEMSNLEQEARHDGIRGGFNPNKLLQGKATPREFALLEKALRLHKDNPPLTFVHDMGARSLSSMIAKAHQYKPDLVIVDGMYLMDAEIPDMGNESWQALTKVSRSIKVMAQTLKIPVFATTQALDSKWNPKQGLTAKAAAYTSAFGQDCDVMLGIEPPTDSGMTATLRLITGRNVGRAVAGVTFDWDHGRIEELANWDGESENDNND